MLMIPLVTTFASPASTGQHAVAYGVIAAVATGYGIVLARRFGAAAVVEGQRVRAAHATVVALVFGAILGGAAVIGVAADSAGQGVARLRWPGTGASHTDRCDRPERASARPGSQIWCRSATVG